MGGSRQEQIDPEGIPYLRGYLTSKHLVYHPLLVNMHMHTPLHSELRPHR